MASLVLDFADGKYSFMLPVAGILELQEKTGAGFGAVFARAAAGVYKSKDETELIGFPLDAQFHLKDLLETIRLALVGGGTDPVDAVKLVERYCYPAQPMKKTWELAVAILLSSMEGFEVKAADVDEPDVKKKATKSRTRKVALTPEQSMPT